MIYKIDVRKKRNVFVSVDGSVEQYHFSIIKKGKRGFTSSFFNEEYQKETRFLGVNKCFYRTIGGKDIKFSLNESGHHLTVIGDCTLLRVCVADQLRNKEKTKWKAIIPLKRTLK